MKGKWTLNIKAITQRGMQVPGPLQSIWIVAIQYRSDSNKLTPVIDVNK